MIFIMMIAATLPPMPFATPSRHAISPPFSHIDIDSDFSLIISLIRH
jgi:hypothetical protein